MNRLVSTFQALHEASVQLESDAPDAALLQTIIDEGIVRPLDNESLAYWYARYLSIRESLWALINECLAKGDSLQTNNASENSVWSVFVVGYSAACLLIKNDQLFLFDVAHHSTLQRKFNEAFAEYRIPRKQYTTIFSAFVDLQDAFRIHDAIRLAAKNQAIIHGLHDDPVVGDLARHLPVYEQWLNTSKRTFFQRSLVYFQHKWRRKGVVALNNILFKSTEKVGRAASQIQLPLKKRVSIELRRAMVSELKPGDVLVTRHDTAFTNLFLPGFWPHAALYVGTPEQRKVMGITVSDDTATRWSGNHCVFEALKDGLHFRPITDTLAVDNFVVLRPNLSDAEICEGIERVVVHEGKLYNFDFDFFSSDKLVCSEVIYRAFDGVGGVSFPLTERAGRKTFSPEDIVSFALNDAGLDVVGIYGVEGSRREFARGETAIELATLSLKEKEG